MSLRLAVERLMLLDAVLTMPNLESLATVAEKAAYLAKLKTVVAADVPPEQPAGTPSGTAPELAAALPIGVAPDGRVTVLYLATEPCADGFRAFLQRHATILRLAPTWTLRLVFPRPLDRFCDAYQTVVREELQSPLQPANIRELKWCFEHRRQAAAGQLHPQTQEFVDVGAKVLGTARFAEMYRRWLKQGNAVFEGPSSPAIAEALRDGRGRVETVVLGHSYRHLFPLVAEASAPPQFVEKG